MTPHLRQLKPLRNTTKNDKAKLLVIYNLKKKQ